MTSWKEAYARIQAADGEVVEISADSIPSHRRWVEDLGGVPFPMLADFTKQTCRAFGALNEERGTPIRSVFVVDKGGVVRYKNPAFDAANASHYEEALVALQACR